MTYVQDASKIDPSFRLALLEIGVRINNRMELIDEDDKVVGFYF